MTGQAKDDAREEHIHGQVCFTGPHSCLTSFASRKNFSCKSLFFIRVGLSHYAK